MGRYVEELRDVPENHEPGAITYCWNNPFWNNADALVHYGLLRHLQPRRIVEVGCGFSSSGSPTSLPYTLALLTERMEAVRRVPEDQDRTE